MPNPSFFITVFSVLTVASQLIAALLVAFLLHNLLTKRPSALLRWFSAHALLLMFIVALSAMVGSLYFSDIAGWNPCKKCWLQRIFLYPQVILLGVALWKRDRTIAPYILALCVIGIVLSADHYIEQVMAALQPVTEVDPLKPCDTTGVSCAKTEIHFTFGYITIPMMALTASLLNGLGSFIILREKKSV